MSPSFTHSLISKESPRIDGCCLSRARRLKHSHIAMLGTSEDKVVSGKDLQDTYIKMLASLPRVTEAIAKGIVAEYPTVRSLYERYERCRDERERKEMLVGIGVRPSCSHTLCARLLSCPPPPRPRVQSIALIVVSGHAHRKDTI